MLSLGHGWGRAIRHEAASDWILGGRTGAVGLKKAHRSPPLRTVMICVGGGAVRQEGVARFQAVPSPRGAWEHHHSTTTSGKKERLKRLRSVAS